MPELLSTGLRSPIAPGIAYMCGEKASPVMVLCDAKGLGGDDDVGFELIAGVLEVLSKLDSLL